MKDQLKEQQNVVVDGVKYVNQSTDKVQEKSLSTTIPFFKNNELNYGEIVEWVGLDAAKWT